MASEIIQPIQRFDKLINTDGTATELFLRILQLRKNLVSDIDSLIEEILTRSVLAGTALDGGGNLGAGDVTIDHADQANDVGTFGDATHVAQITVDAQGHVTDVVEVAVSGGGGGGGLYDISMGVPVTPTTIGDGAKFTWTENAGKGLNVKYGSGGLGPNLAGWIIPRASGSAWEWAALLMQNNTGAQYYGVSLGLYNSGNSKLINITDFTGQYQGTEFMQWNSYSNRSSTTTVGTDSAHAQDARWLHIKDDGAGNIQIGMSYDGANPVWRVSTTVGTFIGGYDNVFVGGFFETNIDVPGCSTSVLCIDNAGASRVVGV